MIQPQKRELVRKLLDACLGRVVELKHDLVNIDLMEFSYNDEVVERLRLTPMEMELRIPRYFLREREEELELRKRTMHELLIKLGWLEEHPLEEPLTEIEAIRLLQMHERARQGRLRAHFMKEIRKEKGKSEDRTDKERTDSGLMAAMKIQKMWRGHTARRITRRRKMDEMILIGMVPPPASVLKERTERFERNNETDVRRRHVAQKSYAAQFEARQLAIQEEIKLKHGATMKEDIADEIRAWIKDCYDKTGKLPDFPSEDQGGSLHIFSRPGTESEHSRSSARSSKESRKTKDKSKSPARSGDLNVNDNQEEDVNFQPAASVCLPDIRAEIEL